MGMANGVRGAASSPPKADSLKERNSGRAPGVAVKGEEGSTGLLILAPHPCEMSPASWSGNGTKLESGILVLLPALKLCNFEHTAQPLWT